MLFVKMLWTLRRLFIYLFYRKYFALSWNDFVQHCVLWILIWQLNLKPLLLVALTCYYELFLDRCPTILSTLFRITECDLFLLLSLSRSLPPALFQEQYFPISSLSVFFFLSRVQRTGVELNRKIAICHLTCAREKKDKNWHRSLLLSQTGTLRGPSAL